MGCVYDSLAGGRGRVLLEYDDCLFFPLWKRDSLSPDLASGGPQPQRSAENYLLLLFSLEKLTVGSISQKGSHSVAVALKP